MKKGKFIFIAVSLLTITLSFLSFSPSAAQSKSYVSSDKIFIVTYPDDWKIAKLETAGELSLNGPGANLFNTCMVKMEILKLAEGYEKFGIRELAETELKMLKAQQDQGLKLEILESDFKIINGHEWWVVHGKLMQKKDVYFTDNYKTIHNGKTYVFTYFSGEKNFQKNAAAAYSIFESIEFLTKQEVLQNKPPSATGSANNNAANIGSQSTSSSLKAVAGANETAPAAAIGKTGKISFLYAGKKLFYITVRAADGNIWLQQNLGSLQVAAEIRDEKAYGDLFQWGRWADGHQYRVPANTRNAVASPNNPAGLNKTGSNPFYYKGFENWWSSGFKTDTWTASSSSDVTSTNGCDPCKALGSGWHLPSKVEWEKLIQTENITDENGAFMSHLKFPATTGFRDIDNGVLRSNAYGGYWSNTPSTSQGLAAFAFNFDITNAGVGSFYRGIGFSIRCMRNDK